MQEIRLERATSLKPKPTDESKLGFGAVFTDHMLLIRYNEKEGWHDPSIVPYAPLSLDPAAMCLHYSQEIFEGMKAYRGEDNEIYLFRPEENFRRLNSSCERMCIPTMDEGLLLESLKKLVNLERDWVPSAENASLYIRPFIISTEAKLGVKPASEYLYLVILSPSGPYYASGLDPVKIYVESEYVRAVHGGVGMVKTGGNYAASLKAQDEAHRRGCSQVLWLDGVEKRYIEEVGSMNMFFVLGDTVVTPSLCGSILPGITRKSVIELLKSWGVRVQERRVTLEEILEAHENGTLTEAFGTGTAAVVSPVGELLAGEKNHVIGGGKIGTLSQRLYNELTGIQWGKQADPFGWRVIVK